jgi:hypothetical protein
MFCSDDQSIALPPFSRGSCDLMFFHSDTQYWRLCRLYWCPFANKNAGVKRAGNTACRENSPVFTQKSSSLAGIGEQRIFAIILD